MALTKKESKAIQSKLTKLVKSLIKLDNSMDKFEDCLELLHFSLAEVVDELAEQTEDIEPKKKKK